MKTAATKKFMADNDIVPLIADLTKPNPEADQLLEELGNTGKAIPFYAIFPADGRPPIVFSDVPLLQSALIERLETAIAAQVIESGEKQAAGGLPLTPRR